MNNTVKLVRYHLRKLGELEVTLDDRGADDLSNAVALARTWIADELANVESEQGHQAAAAAEAWIEAGKDRER